MSDQWIEMSAPYLDAECYLVQEISGEGPWATEADLPRLDIPPGYRRVLIHFRPLGNGRGRFRIVDREMRVTPGA